MLLAVGLVACSGGGSGSGEDEAARVATSEVATSTTTIPRTTTTVDLAALQAEYDTAVAASCAEAVAAPLDQETARAASQQDTDYKRRWKQLDKSESGFVAAVRECAEPQRQERLANECTAEPAVELLNRNPAEFKGQCFTLVVSIVQFDQNTGPCSFRARFDTSVREYSFEYLGENSLVTFTRPCPQLNSVGTDDVLRLEAIVMGGTDYETTFGGRTTAVSFKPVGDFEILENN